jgi:hypothetical protein
MDATPFEQVAVVAVATYCTGELTVLLFTGDVTITPVVDAAGVTVTVVVAVAVPPVPVAVTV